MDDIRFSWRRLRKQPLAAIASVLTLACAIGAGGATWSLLASLLLSPLPVQEPERLFAVSAQVAMLNGGTRTANAFFYPDYQLLRDGGLFAGLAAGNTMEALVGIGDGRPQPRAVAYISHDYFETLGVRLQAGREFTDAEDRRGLPVLAVLSDRFWRGAMNGDPEAIGRELRFPTRVAVG